MLLPGVGGVEIPARWATSMGQEKPLRQELHHQNSPSGGAISANGCRSRPLDAVPDRVIWILEGRQAHYCTRATLDKSTALINLMQHSFESRPASLSHPTHHAGILNLVFPSAWCTFQVKFSDLQSEGCRIHNLNRCRPNSFKDEEIKDSTVHRSRRRCKSKFSC